MTPLHPHWQSTEDEQPVRVRDASQPKRVGISRLPAAIVGIALILGAAVYSFGGLETILGQVTPQTADVTVRLTPDGADPVELDIRPGQVIRWINDDQIPHILTSETLPSGTNEPFASSAIFPQSDFFYTVPANAVSGTHEYVSETAGDIGGEITIIGAAGVTTSTSSAGTIAVSSAPIPVVSPTSSAAPFPTPIGQTTSLTPVQPPAAGNPIAVNPHVVGAKLLPGQKATAVTQHTPSQHTESGPAVWIVLAVSIGALCYATRGAFRRL